MRCLALVLYLLFATLPYLRAEQLRPEPSANLVNGIDAYNRGNYAMARDLLQAAADSGEPEAMVNLGYMFARGQGVRADPQYALDLYRRAADAGDAEGMNAVGYRYNYAIKPDLPKAIHWYCLAVIRGNSRAMNNLAHLFYNGQGVPQDIDEAMRLWRQSAARGDLNAQANIGMEMASNTTRSQAERSAGVQILRDAAREGDKFAQDLLRQNGDPEAFPSPTFSELTMRLEPRNPLPGSSRACGDVIS